MTKPYDIVVLGGGVGGYSAAIRAAQLGKTVALVERDKLGGTCLHRGCIPSKSMLRSAEVYAQTKISEEYGVIAGSVTLDFNRVNKRKRDIVGQLYRGLQSLMKKNKIDVIEGNGRIIGPSIFSPRSGSVAVETADGEAVTLIPGHLIIATGSSPRTLPGMPADGGRVLTSDEALELDELPTSIVIIGGGVIGVEWASMLSDFGVDVTVVEFEKRLVPTEDAEVSRELEKLLGKRGVKIVTSAKVLPDRTVIGEDGVTIVAERGAETVTLRAEKVLVSIGRAPNVNGIGLENTDVKTERGAVVVNAALQTAESHIYAIGDVTGGVQLAHAAAHAGISAAEHIAGLKPHAYEAHRIPRCIYSRPEIASVGWTEAQAVERGYRVKTAKVPFRAIGKALVQGEADGFAKVVADEVSGDLLGVHMIGPHVTELIAEAALAQVLEAVPWEIAQTVHPHPTLSEVLGEAMLAVDGKAIAI